MDADVPRLEFAADAIRNGSTGIRTVVVFASAALTLVGQVRGVRAEPEWHERVTPAFSAPIPNVSGKSLVSAVVDYPPGAKSPPHRHATSAFVYAFVVSGAIRSQVGDAPAQVYRAGESFSEPPGAHHAISENASDTEPARLLAVFVLDTGDHPLTTPDP